MNRDIDFDAEQDRLVFLMGAPDQSYWEDLWERMITREAITRGDRFVTPMSQHARFSCSRRLTVPSMRTSS